MGNWPPVTVAMAVWNEEATLAPQLDALAGQHYPGWWELVIADDDSTDDSMRIVAGFADRIPALRVIAAGGRPEGDRPMVRNEAHPKNQAVDSARGEIVLLCDADDVVQPGWIQALVEALSHCDIAGGVTDHEAVNPPLVNQWYSSPIARRRGRVHAAPNLGVSGGNMAVRRQLWDAMGGWDETLVSADVDFVRRAEAAGCSVGPAPGALVFVRRRSSLRAAVNQAYRRGVGAAQLRELRPDQPPRALDRRGLIRNAAFVVVAWPAALVWPSVRGYWLRTAAFLFGAGRGRLGSLRTSTIGP